ncbi:succinate dehydrogenase 5 [Zostera marina]|uniref:Succinate dehydrogenase 5 n=1 Tax=Zostera marina TaxID=29655 RepID=A0A0K9PJ36_ZOSMR|nr:succinate dehydrogenase 5 [Zostera marina]
MLRVAGKRVFAGRLGLGLGIGHHASQLPSSSGVGTGAMNAMIMNRMRHLRSVDRHFSSHTKSGSVGFLSSVPSSFRVLKSHPALGFRRLFSAGATNLPAISDPDVGSAFKELMALNWDDIPSNIISSAKKAVTKETEDKIGQKALSDVFCAAEASVEFTAILVNIRMALEERAGMTGESVSELPTELANAIIIAYNRYIAYVNSFGPDENYLRKKVEAELGTRLIHLKQRVSGLGSEWGEINVIGTSGLSGSYVELRNL